MIHFKLCFCRFSSLIVLLYADFIVLQKEDRISPSTCPPAGTKPADVNVVPGNPIWLGGSGPEMGFVPGKRFMKKDLKESPFAVSSEWMGYVMVNYLFHLFFDFVITFTPLYDMMHE